MGWYQRRVHGYRSCTRDLLSLDQKKRGYIPPSTYLRTFKLNDYLDIKINSKVSKGMPHKVYQGRTGKVFNITKRGLGIEINKRVRGHIKKKRIHVRIEHVYQSRCREDFLKRVRAKNRLKDEEKSLRHKISIKRQPIAPLGSFILKNTYIENVKIAPYCEEKANQV